MVPQLLFLVPAHDEELLLGRTLESLLSLDYDPDKYQIVVVADNCSDKTAEVAQHHGVAVLERTNPELSGKGEALGWALSHVCEREFDALVIIDSDTIVNTGFAAALAGVAGIRQCAIQSFDGPDNEFDNWLTILAGILSRYRFDVAISLKRAAGLNSPLAGTGTLIGRGVLDEHGWPVYTITEGWELYAYYTLNGVECKYVPGARLLAQEARELSQSRGQRERWTKGRFAVLGIYLRGILTNGRVGALQRLDLLAELSSPGPVSRGVLGVVGAGMALATPYPASLVLVVLFATGVLQPLWYSVLALRTHPRPRAVVKAVLRLPVYAVWRVGIAVLFMLTRTKREWHRTRRHGM